MRRGFGHFSTALGRKLRNFRFPKVWQLIFWIGCIQMSVRNVQIYWSICCRVSRNLNGENCDLSTRRGGKKTPWEFTVMITLFLLKYMLKSSVIPKAK